LEALNHIIEQAYELFSGNKPGEYLDACTICCMKESDAAELKSIALRHIPLELLTEYQDAARPEKLDLRELKYFAPRYLELVKNYQFPSFEPLLSLSRFGYFKASDWTEAERTLLDKFALLFFKDYLNSIDKKDLPSVDALLMFYKGNFDIKMLLVAWEKTESDESLFHFSKLLDTMRITKWGKLEVTDAFSDGQFNQQIIQWISSVKVKKLFREKIEQTIMKPGEIFTASDLEELSWKYDLIR